MNKSAPKVYALYIALDECMDYRFDAYEEMDYWDGFLAHNFKGTPLPAGWKLPRHTVGHLGSALNDFVQGYTAAPFASERARLCLLPVLRSEAEFRAIGPISSQEYYVMNVVNLVDCLNEKESDILRAEDGRILSLRQARFLPDRIPNASLFKVPEDTGRIYATDRFVTAVRAHQLTGIGFEPSDNVGVGVINRAFRDLPVRK